MLDVRLARVTINQMRVQKYFVVAILLVFLGGCSSIKNRTGKKAKRSQFYDPEIAAFWEGQEQSPDTLQFESRRLFPSSQYGPRPPWASKNYIGHADINYIDKSGWGITGTRGAQSVVDSIHKKLLDRIALSISTTVETWVEDSLVSSVFQSGRGSDWFREHIFTTVSRHYSPTINFAREYYSDENWKDPDSDTLWHYVRFDIYRYEQSVIDRLEKSGEEAYHYLKTAHDYYNIGAKMEQALKTLGVASYHVSRGGGTALKENLFQPGLEQFVKIQLSYLITEMKKDIRLVLLDSHTERVVTRDKSFTVRLASKNPKGLDLNGVRLRIDVGGNYLNYPSVMNLISGGKADIEFSLKPEVRDAFGKTITVNVTFDVISELMPDREWYKTQDYGDLLVELPSVSFDITLMEFLSPRSWAVVSEQLPIKLEEKHLLFQKQLQIALGKYPNYFNVIPLNNWPVDYEKVRRHKSGTQVNLTLSELQDMQEHDLDALLSVDEIGEGVFTVTLQVSSPRELGGGLLSASLENVTLETIPSPAIGNVVERFVQDNLEKQIIIRKPRNVKLDVTFNGKRKSPSQESEDEMIFLGLSRFISYELTVKSAGFRRKSFFLFSDPFSLSMRRPEPHTVSVHTLEPENGTLRVSVYDKLTNRPVRTGKRFGAPPKITVKRRWWVFPDPLTKKVVSDTSALASFKIERLGKYYVSVSKQFYSPVLPQLITVIDDEDPRSKTTNQIKFYLVLSPIPTARMLSALVPGTGQWYLGKKKQAMGFFAGILLSAAWGFYEYEEFKRVSEHFETKKTEYRASLDPDEWPILESDLDNIKGSIGNHRNRIFGSMALYGVIWGFNLFTVAL